LKAFQQPAKEPFGRFGVPSWLNENIEHDAALVHGTPKIVLHAFDPDEHLIKVPLVAEPRTTAAQVVAEALTKFLASAPNGLIGDDDAPLGQQKFNISKAEAEYVIQPDGMGDEFGWKPMAIVRVGWALHPVSLAGPQPECQTRLT